VELESLLVNKMLFLYLMYFNGSGWHRDPLAVLLIVSLLVVLVYPAIYWSFLVQKQTSGLRIANYLMMSATWATVVLWPTPFFFLVAILTAICFPVFLIIQLIVPALTILQSYKARNKPVELPRISRNQTFTLFGIYYGGFAVAIFLTHLIGWPNPLS